jgi:hypothetical protein
MSNPTTAVAAVLTTPVRKTTRERGPMRTPGRMKIRGRMTTITATTTTGAEASLLIFILYWNVRVD